MMGSVWASSASVRGALFSLKGLILIALLVQNCTVVMLTRHVRVRERPAGMPLFSVVSVVMMTEIVKIIVCFGWAFVTLLRVWPPSSSPYTPHSPSASANHLVCGNGGGGGVGGINSSANSGGGGLSTLPAMLGRLLLSPLLLVTHLRRTVSVIFFRVDALYMIVPAALFTLQNNILYVALENLEVSTFQILYQSKLFLTAVLVAVVFRKQYSATKWVALVMLFLGVVATQMDHGSGKKNRQQSGGSSSADDSNTGSSVMLSAGDYGLGIAAAITAALSSAVASVVMERLLKGALQAAPPAPTAQQQQQRQLPQLGSAPSVGKTHEEEEVRVDSGAADEAQLLASSVDSPPAYAKGMLDGDHQGHHPHPYHGGNSAVGSSGIHLIPVPAMASAVAGGTSSSSFASPQSPHSATAGTSSPTSPSTIATTSTSTTRSNCATAIQIQAAVSLPARNVQLALYSIIISVMLMAQKEVSASTSPPAAAAVGASSSGSISISSGSGGFLAGFDVMVWAIVLTQAIGGIIVALVLRYADNVLKGCAVAMAIVICGLFSIFFFGMAPSWYFIIGAIVVTVSVFVFTASA